MKRIHAMIRKRAHWQCEEQSQLLKKIHTSSFESTVKWPKKSKISSMTTLWNSASIADQDNQVLLWSERIRLISYNSNEILNNSLFFLSIDPRFQTSSVGQELRKTLSNLEKTTHNFVREHGELANRAEYLKYTDYVRQHEKNKK